MCDSCSTANYNPATVGTVGAYSGLAASKSVVDHKRETRQVPTNIRRISPIGIVLAVIIVIILVALIVWLISSFFLCKNTKQKHNKDQSCVGESCINSSDCEPGLTCSNGICVSN